MKSLWLLSSMFSFFKQIRKIFVFKGSAYILLDFFFLVEDFSWISFLN